MTRLDPALVPGDNLDEAYHSAILSGRNRDGSTYTLPVTRGLDEEAGRGRVKTYGTGLLTAVAAGNVRVTLANLTADHVLTLVGLYVASTVAGMGTVRLNPTTGLPATSAVPVGLNALVGGGDAGKATVKADSNATTALGGGTDTGIILGAGANTPGVVALPAPVILAPGSPTIGIGVNLGAAFTFAAWLTFLETPLGQ